MSPSQVIPAASDYVRLLPEIVLAIFGMVIMVLDPLMDEQKSQKALGAIGLVGTLSALLSTWFMTRSPGLAFWNMVRVRRTTWSDTSCVTASCPLPPDRHQFAEAWRLRAGARRGR